MSSGLVDAAEVLLRTEFDDRTRDAAILAVANDAGALTLEIETAGDAEGAPIRWSASDRPPAKVWTWILEADDLHATIRVGAPTGDEDWAARWQGAFMHLARLLLAARRRGNRLAAAMEIARRGVLASLNETLEHRRRLAEVNELLERQNRELVTANAAGREAARLKNEFLANMSHELRTPLNAALGFLNLYLNNPAATEADRRECVETARGSAEELLALINRVLDLANLEAGRVSVTPMDVPLSLVFEDLAMTAAATAKGRAAALRVEPAPEADPPLSIHLPKLRDVFRELLDNAFKFTLEGVVSIAAHLEGRDYVRVEIRDTGVGIDPDRIPALFSPFTQAEGGLNRRFGGAGLGLAVARKSLELMGGALVLESEGVGKGSTAVVRLPLSVSSSLDAVSSAVHGASKSSRAPIEGRALRVAAIGLPDELIESLRPRLQTEEFHFEVYVSVRSAAPRDPDAAILMWSDEADLDRVCGWMREHDSACVVLTTQPESAVRARMDTLSDPRILSVFPLAKVAEDPAVLARVLTRYRRRLASPA